MTTATEQKLTQLIEPLMTDEGLELVQVSLLGEGRGLTLQVLAENPLTRTLDLDSCTRLSRRIGTMLEVEDPIKSAYRLEISSPGIDRPLTKPAHFIRYQGFEIKAETILPIGDQKRFHGRIVAADENAVTIETDTKTVQIAYTDLARAKLKLTDALIAAMRPAQTSQDNDDLAE